MTRIVRESGAGTPSRSLRAVAAVAVALIVAGASPSTAQTPDEIVGAYGPPAAVAVRQDSLLEIALNSPDAVARAAAIRGIASPGTAWYFMHGVESEAAPIHYPGTVARLARIYQVGSRSDRETITRALARQAERAEAVRLLGAIAGSEDLGNDRPLAPAAVGALSTMGADGAAELRALHAAVGDSRPLIRRQLEELARTGYRQPPRG